MKEEKSLDKNSAVIEYLSNWSSLLKSFRRKRFSLHTMNLILN